MKLLRKILLFASLALSAVVVAVWVRSYFIGDRYRWLDCEQRGDVVTARGGRIMTGMGGVTFVTAYEQTSDPDYGAALLQRTVALKQMLAGNFASMRAPRYPIRGVSEDSLLSSLGFSGFYLPEHPDPQTWRRQMGITVPFWSLFALTMAYPLGLYVAGVVRRQREERLALGLCPRCGVAIKDESQRCPGCDRAVPEALVRHA